jgi:hypothetical protein
MVTFGGRLRQRGPEPKLSDVEVHIFIDFGQLCSSKPTTHVHGNRTVVFMISATRFHPGQHP